MEKESNFEEMGLSRIKWKMSFLRGKSYESIKKISISLRTILGIHSMKYLIHKI